MKKKNQIDVFEMISTFQQTVLSNKPSKEQMSAEVQMMKFRIKPVLGDISGLNFNNNDFIESLWSLGKVDEFFQTHGAKLKSPHREMFYRLVDELRYTFQHELNDTHIKSEQLQSTSQSMFEMEIVKDRGVKFN